MRSRHSSICASPSSPTLVSRCWSDAPAAACGGHKKVGYALAISLIAQVTQWLLDQFSAVVDWQVIVESLPALFMGLIRTFELVIFSIGLGFALAIPLALLRVSPNPIAWMPVYAYIYVMRGTPLLVQLYLIYYGSAQI